jgi:hypothetical protein
MVKKTVVRRRVVYIGTFTPLIDAIPTTYQYTKIPSEWQQLEDPICDDRPHRLQLVSLQFRKEDMIFLQNQAFQK